MFCWEKFHQKREKKLNFVCYQQPSIFIAESDDSKSFWKLAWSLTWSYHGPESMYTQELFWPARFFRGIRRRLKKSSTGVAVTQTIFHDVFQRLQGGGSIFLKLRPMEIEDLTHAHTNTQQWVRLRKAWYETWGDKFLRRSHIYLPYRYMSVTMHVCRSVRRFYVLVNV